MAASVDELDALVSDLKTKVADRDLKSAAKTEADAAAAAAAETAAHAGLDLDSSKTAVQAAKEAIVAKLGEL